MKAGCVLLKILKSFKPKSYLNHMSLPPESQPACHHTPSSVSSIHPSMHNILTLLHISTYPPTHSSSIHSVCPFIHLPTYLPILPFEPSIHPSFHLSVQPLPLHPAIYPHTYHSSITHSLIKQSINLPISLSIIHSLIHLSTHPFVHASMHHPCVHLSNYPVVKSF